MVRARVLLTLQLAVTFLDSEESGAGEKLLNEGLAVLRRQDHPSSLFCVPYLHHLNRVGRGDNSGGVKAPTAHPSHAPCRQLAILWSGRGEHEQALGYLQVGQNARVWPWSLGAQQ